jgi:uncharacterized protein YeaO (DUF488 family)
MLMRESARPSASRPLVTLKRAYVEPAADDGTRVLVERLWPRGLSKERAQIDLWLRDIAPSTELRQWYAHDVARWDDFRERYLAELRGEAQSAALDRLRALARQGPVTLVFATRDAEHAGAEVVRQVLSMAE